jgi:hypothetical protein
VTVALDSIHTLGLQRLVRLELQAQAPRADLGFPKRITPAPTLSVRRRRRSKALGPESRCCGALLSLLSLFLVASLSRALLLVEEALLDEAHVALHDQLLVQHRPLEGV